MHFLTVAIGALLVIAAATVLGPRLGVASQLILVLVGIGASFVPEIAQFEVDPDLVLEVLLPPLLYSASISMPAMDFRRELRKIGALSVLLVVFSSLALALFFSWVIPGLSFGWALALGAVLSPTDAVATAIVKKVGVTSRVVTVLEGESLLNDATALVLLRAAVVGAVAGFSPLAVVGNFLYAAVAAVGVGFAVGWLNLRVRARVASPAANTVLSFAVPFLASIPTELLGASGLVAAVTAGLVTGTGATRWLSPQHRLSDFQTWKAVDLVLEGAIFLTMGVQLSGLMADVVSAHEGLLRALWLALAALAITLVVRAAYVTLLWKDSARRRRRIRAMKPRILSAQEYLNDPDGAAKVLEVLHERRSAAPRRLRFRSWIAPRRSAYEEDLRRQFARLSADADYFLSTPLGWREGAVTVWAGMRGAITLAAAQTLPWITPHRSLLVFIAFAVAVLSLLIQGGTLGPVVRWIKPQRDDPEEIADDRVELRALVNRAAAEARADGEHGVGVIQAQRQALLLARADGRFSSRALTDTLAVLDAAEIQMSLQHEPIGR